MKKDADVPSYNITPEELENETRNIISFLFFVRWALPGLPMWLQPVLVCGEYHSLLSCQRDTLTGRKIFFFPSSNRLHDIHLSAFHDGAPVSAIRRERTTFLLSVRWMRSAPIASHTQTREYTSSVCRISFLCLSSLSSFYVIPSF